jgi:thymidylate synthase
LEADEFVHFLGNCHIYEDHVMPLKIQIERNPFHFPTIEICNRHANIDDYNISDIKWINPYLSHSSLKMKMQA